MWLNQLFIEIPLILRRGAGTGLCMGYVFILLGAAAIGLSFAIGNHAMVMYLEQGYKDFYAGILRRDRIRPGRGWCHNHHTQSEISAKSRA